MLKSRSIFLTFTFVYFVLLINCQDGILSQIRDEFREPLIDFRPLKNQSHKHSLDLKNVIKLPDSPRVLQQTSESNDSVEENIPKWESKLSEQEKISYKKMIDLKNSFASSLTYLPEYFEPENPEYLQRVFQIMINFFYAVGAIGFLVLVYLVLRFCCKKCVGPVKMSQITRSYRNATWIILISSLVGIVTIFSVVLSFSFKINSSFTKVADDIKLSSSEINKVRLNAFNDITKNLETLSQNLPLVQLKITKENLEKINSEIKLFNTNTEERIDFLSKWENRRNLFIIITFAFYLLIGTLSFLGFSKRWPGFLLSLSIIILFTLPLLIAFGGLLASHYFVYADFCEDVYDAVYNSKFPICDKRIGYFISCFNVKTKAAIYSFKYELESYENELSQNYGESSLTQVESEVYSTIINSINTFKSNHLYPLIECNHVYSNILSAEANFCKYGMNWTYSLFTSMSWLFLILLLCSYAINRLKPLVEKRKNEIEV